MARLSDLSVLVTAASSSVGQATISRLVGEGAAVLAGDTRDAQALAEMFGERVQGIDLDVTSPDSWESIAAAVRGADRGLHGVVNTAASIHTGPLSGQDPGDLRAMIDVNLLGPALGIRTMGPLLADSGGGSIVNIASTEALRGSKGAAVFSATNWGLRGLTRSAALELGSQGIRVNTVCPAVGVIHPDRSSGASKLVDGGQLRQVTVGDVAAMVTFLLSDDSATCTGGDFVVDAGSTASTALG